MSLPPGFLDELRTRVTLSRIVGRKVTWDQRKSNQAKGDLWAPCPFHQEKSASFHVDDRKGYYYCFGCHAKGDAIYNKALAQRRAESVKAAIMQQFGIAGDRITAVGQGEEDPIAPNDTDAGRAINRRVEVQIQ